MADLLRLPYISLYLPYIFPTSSLYLPVSRLHLPYISPISRLHLAQVTDLLRGGAPIGSGGEGHADNYFHAHRWVLEGRADSP